MGKWRRAGIPKTKECDTHRKTFLAPEFNFSYHPFLGTILISNKLAWSATGLKIIIGGTMDIANALQSSSEGFLKIRYNLLAFHDGERYWRVPDIPNEMFDSKNFLIEKGVPLWGEPLNTSKKIHPPQSLFKELKIEGRFLSQHFIKHPEKKRPLKSTKKDECDSASMPDSDVSYVLHSSYQVSAGDKI
uniref:Uncharacterized protein n=1 Tax=Panagrolaimus superbus TaxID=310955 RepID=A0A914YQ20_9BILA